MEKFFETDTLKPQTDNNSANEREVKLELTPLELSDGDKIEVGKNTLTYLEGDKSKYAQKDLKKVEHFKEISLLPKDMTPDHSFLFNEEAGGIFTGLTTPDGTIYYVKFRTLKLGNIPDSENKFDTISSSQCIFGHGETKANLKDGSSEIFRNGSLESDKNSDQILPQQILGWEIDDRISAYELEALYRQVSFINNLVSDDTKFSKVILNTPRVEYYLSGLNYYQKGLLSSKLLQEWFEIIDRRTDRLNKLISERLHDSLSVTYRSPLEELREYMKNQVKLANDIVFDDALKILSQDKLWEDVVDIKKPETWLDLVNIAIAVEELRNSFQTGDGTVIVKSPKQESTLYQSRDIAKRLHSDYNVDFNLVAMYPHERIIVSHDTPKRALLSYIPEPMSVSSAKKVIGQYNLNNK